MTQRVVAFGRRLYRALGRWRRAIVAVLAVALGLAVVGVVATRSWLALLATSLAVIAILTGVALEVRRLQLALRRTQQVHQAHLTEIHRSLDARVAKVERTYKTRLMEFERTYRTRAGEIQRAHQDKVAALEHSQALLATVLCDHAKAAGHAIDSLPTHLMPGVVNGLLERGDALDAYALTARSESLSDLELKTLRRLRVQLKKRGYLTKAREVSKVCVELSPDPRDLREQAAIEGEIAVLSGTFTPAIRPEEESFTPRARRILHVVGNSLPQKQSGYTLRTHYTALAQRSTGLDPHVVTQMGFGHEGSDYATEEVDGITYHRIPGPPRGTEPLDRWMGTHVQRLANVVRATRPAVLHAASDFLNAVAADVVGREFGIPVVYESRGFWEETWLSRQAQTFGWDLDTLEAEHGLPDVYLWRRDIEDRCRREADRVVTLADVMADRIEAGGVPRERIAVVPNGVDVDAFPVQSRNLVLATQLGIDEAAVVVGYISSIVEYEGIDTLVSAFAALKASSPAPVKLLVVGDGPERDGLIQQAVALGMDQDAIFPGSVSHDAVLDFYSLIDIFVVPRKPVEVCHLVTPLKPFEAFSTGRGVVLSNVRALARIAEQSGAAELFEAGDAGSLASILIALVKDPQRRKELAEAGAAWVRAERTWASNADAYITVYEELGAIPLGELSVPRLRAEHIDVDRVRKNLADHEPIPFEVLSSDDAGHEDAESIMNEGWSSGSHPVVNLHLPIDWINVCRANRSWDFKLHSWDFMGPVLRAHSVTADKRYLDWCIETAVSWARTFNEGDARGTMAWYDMALGLRGHRLAYIVEQALVHGTDPATVSTLLTCVVRHQHEFFSDAAFNGRNNHGLYVAVGQLALSRRLRDLPGMKALEAQGRDRLTAILHKQFAPDGGHLEHSPDYHRMVLGSVKGAVDAGLLGGGEIGQRLELAEEVLGWFIQPNGEIAQLGDSPARQMRSNRECSSSATTEFLVSTGRRGVPHTDRLRVLPHTGYAIVRAPQPQDLSNHEASSYLVVAAGFHSRTHKHADDLTMVWFDRGHEILIDAGRYGYVDPLPKDSPLRRQGYFYSAPERQYVESTRAHNTIEIDGTDHTRRGREPYGSGQLDAEEIDGYYRIRAEVDHTNWRHHRELIFYPGHWLYVIDTVVAQDELHDYRAWWNLPAGATPESVEYGLRIALPGSSETLWVTELNRSQLIHPVTAQREPLRGWRSKRDLELTPAWSFGFEATNTQEHRFQTLFSFGTKALTAPPHNPFQLQ